MFHRSNSSPIEEKNLNISLITFSNHNFDDFSRKTFSNNISNSHSNSIHTFERVNESGLDIDSYEKNIINSDENKVVKDYIEINLSIRINEEENHYLKEEDAEENDDFSSSESFDSPEEKEDKDEIVKNE